MITDVITSRIVCKAEKIQQPHPQRCKMIEGYRVHFSMRELERIGIFGVEEFVIDRMQEHHRLYHYNIKYSNGFFKPYAYLNDIKYSNRFFEPYAYLNDDIKQPKRKLAYSKEEAEKIANDVRDYLNNLEVLDIYTKKDGKSTINKQPA